MTEPLKLTPREQEQVEDALEAESTAIPELVEAAKKLDFSQFPGRNN